MKAYTDVAQSRKLAEILPIESADFMWEYDPDKETYWDTPTMIQTNLIDSCTFINDIPCWSLTALLEVIRVECRMEKTPLDQSGEFTYSMVDDYNSIRTFECDNPVDACFEMILNLNEQNLL